MLLGTALTAWLVPFLTIFTDNQWYYSTLRPSEPSLRFDLRHVHAVSPSSRVVIADVPPATQANSNSDSDVQTSYTVRTRTVNSYRSPSFHIYARARRRSMSFAQSEDFPWEPDEIPGPDVESRESLLQLAKMANNAYVPPNDTAWYDLGENWEPVGPFLWFTVHL